GEARRGLCHRGRHVRGVGTRTVRGLRTAVAFLTRIPVCAGGAVGPADLGRSVPFIPVVGALIGLVVAGVDIGARTILPSFVAAVLAIGAGVVLTGALHEDGLGDTADAL